MSLDKLSNLMRDIDKNRSSNFSGLGIVLYSRLINLPVSPLKDIDSEVDLPIYEYKKILELLLKISVFNHPFHDGFHLINNAFSLTHLSQYFSTPIMENSKIEYQYGSRYRTGLYGSFLKDVIACGVIGNNHGPIIFVKGEKINPYE